MRIVFFGTPDFAVPALRRLADRFDVALVVTRPDRPVGRGGRLTAPPVASAARELDLDLLLFGDVACRTARLTLPHPRALGRRFVMTPAAEVAPDWTWPGAAGTIAEIARALVTDETLERLARAPNGGLDRTA